MTIYSTLLSGTKKAYNVAKGIAGRSHYDEHTHRRVLDELDARGLGHEHYFDVAADLENGPVEE